MPPWSIAARSPILTSGRKSFSCAPNGLSPAPDIAMHWIDVAARQFRKLQHSRVLNRTILHRIDLQAAGRLAPDVQEAVRQSVEPSSEPVGVGS